MLTFDFETEAIAGNTTAKPPKPVGLAYKLSERAGQYLAWGHPTGNSPNAFDKARAVLLKAIAAKMPMLAHHSKFDIAVAMKHMDIPFDKVDPLLIHDTEFLLFLHDPYASTFSLKPSSERILGIPPDEQDALKQWILAHVPEATEKNFGAYISKAPASVVGPYAIGDVDRTYALYKKLYPLVPKAAYERELLLRPILMESEGRGILCDYERLECDMADLEAALLRCDETLHDELGDYDDSKPTTLADALERAGKIGQWVLTPTGKRSTSRDNLEKAIADESILRLLQYRGALGHLLSNFGRPWIAFCKDFKGRLHPEWNQVRQMRGDSKDTKGTKTGRLSCSAPNFQNMPNEYEIVIPKGFPPLPLMRQYMLADEGMMWLKRDYSQQELRILAHFSEGRLYDRYKEDPRIDAHVETSGLITEYTGLTLPRKHVKITGFSVIYGAGLNSLAEQMGVSYSEAQQVRAAYFKALPEVSSLMRECSARGKSGGTILTWGGREYPVEPSRIKEGRYMDFSYKLLNYLIQGSAGDCTKESLIRWSQDRGAGQFLATVHDENNIQVPKSNWKTGMKLLQNAMESIEFDVRMLSDGFYGTDWANLKECK